MSTSTVKAPQTQPTPTTTPAAPPDSTSTNPTQTEPGRNGTRVIWPRPRTSTTGRRSAAGPPREPRERLKSIMFGHDQPRWVRPSAFTLLLATGLLYFWNLTISGYGNSFYAAAVQAGTKDWTALLFGSLDAGNAITVDKPPASLWIPALLGRVIGFDSFSVLAPQAAMGVAAVGLLYLAVKRVSGPGAGLIAGAALALTPVATLIFRFNNPDALLTLCLVAAGYCVTRAIQRHGARWLFVAGMIIGLAFLTKMLQGFLTIPALGLAYLWAGRPTLPRRLLNLLAPLAGIVVVAGSYLLVFTLTPADQRPYMAGTETNSFLELTFGYNGLGRIFGGEGNGGGGGGGGGGGTAFGGTAGVLRMFNSAFGTEISWLLPAALILLGAGLWFSRRAARTDLVRAALIIWGGWLLVTAGVFSFMEGTIHPYYSVALAPAIAAVVGIGAVELWRGRGFVAPRIVLAAAVLTTSIWSFVLLSSYADWMPWIRWTQLVLGALAATAIAFRLDALRRMSVAVVLAALLASGLGMGSFALATASSAHSGSIPTSGPSAMGAGAMRGGQMGGAPGGATGGAADGADQDDAAGATQDGTAPDGTAPGGTAPDGTAPGTTQDGATEGDATQGDAAQDASTQGGAPGGGGAGGPGGGATSSELTSLLSNTTSKWSAAVTGATSAADLELASDTSVIALGGWNGSDPSPTLEEFQQLVAQGEIHYYVAGGAMGGGPGGSTGGASESADIAQWVQENFTAQTVGTTTVYDLTS